MKQAVMYGGGNIGRVRLKNLRRARTQRLRHGTQGTVALGITRLGQARARPLRTRGESLYLFVHPETFLSHTLLTCENIYLKKTRAPPAGFRRKAIRRRSARRGG